MCIANSRSRRATARPIATSSSTVCRHRRREHQPRRHARRAVVEAGVDGGDERAALGIVEGSRRLPGDRDPQRQMTDQGSRVDRQAGVMEGPDVAREVRPLPAHGPVGVDRGVGRAREVGDGRRERHATHPAIAVDLGGHALRDLADRPAVAQEREVGVAVEVHPAGRDDTVRGVDAFGSGSRRKVADGDDPSTGHADVRPTTRRAGPVDDRAPGQHEVQTGRGDHPSGTVPASTRASTAGTTSPISRSIVSRS